ncbi:MAG: Hsp70 family protein [Gammaproteobacteria bacterium]
MAHACGIDFGTSNSTVGVVRPGQGALLALEDGKLTLPSVVFFNAEDDETSYGRAALAGYLAGYEGRLMRSLKSLLGTSLIDGQTEVAGRALPFRQLLASFIGEVKRRAEGAAGQRFECAVFGRPVYFIDDDADADRTAEDTLAEIARSVGFKHVAFQYEPIAAAFDYESRIEREELVLIADIGGTDFDKYLSLSSVMPLLGYQSELNNGASIPSSYYFNLATWHTINLAYSRKVVNQLADLVRDAREPARLVRLQRLIDERAGHWLAMQVEEGKIALSDCDTVELNLDRLVPPERLRVERAGFEAAVSQLVDAVGATVTRLLADAGVELERIDTLFFTGGSSGVRLLRERIGAIAPNARKVEGDLFGSIGAGLALDAQRKFG